MSIYLLRDPSLPFEGGTCEVCADGGDRPGEFALAYAGGAYLGYFHLGCLKRACWNERHDALDAGSLVDVLYSAFADEVPRRSAAEMLADVFGDEVPVRSDPRAVLAEKLEEFAAEVSRAGDALTAREVDVIADHLNHVWEVIDDGARD